MQPLGPVLTVDLFPEERSSLIEALEQLTDEEWSRPTVCEGWSVKDVALHVLGGDIANISRRRDGHILDGTEFESWDALVAFLNDWNQRWVEVARRTSPRLLIDLLRQTGEDLHRYFADTKQLAKHQAVISVIQYQSPVAVDVDRDFVFSTIWNIAIITNALKQHIPLLAFLLKLSLITTVPLNFPILNPSYHFLGIRSLGP